MSKQCNTPHRDQGNPELAQFFTPAPVAKFMWQAVQLFCDGGLGTGVKIIDPAAGKGSILDVVLSQGEVPTRSVYGIEIDPGLEKQRVGKTCRARFFTGDGLLDEFPGVDPGSFDLVIGNPPFGRLGDILPRQAIEGRWERFSIWRVSRKYRRNPVRQPGLQNMAIDLLFLERALQLARPGGLIAFIMPEGFFANERLQVARDWILEQAGVLGVVDLPAAVFCRPGLRAKTAIVFLRKTPAGRKASEAVLLAGNAQENGDEPLPACLAETLRNMRATRQGRKSSGCIRMPVAQLRGTRWDVRFWQGRVRALELDRRLPLAHLGDYIEHLTYGPIVTGRRPRHVKNGIRVVRQGDFAETGLYLEQALCVAEGSVYDPVRSRVQKGDLLLPRSGAGVLARNRLAVYTGENPANIGCFVDLIRLSGLNPFYAWFFFKTQPGWQQIRSIINGVGTPNINFSEIRSLCIPPIAPEQQKRLERRYFEEVWPLHCRRMESAAILREGECRFRCIVTDLERFLAGKDRTVG